MTIKEQIIAGLKTIEELLDEKGEVNFVKLYDGVVRYDENLLSKLFQIGIIREKFFQKIQLGSDKTEVLGGGYLFKIDSLKLFLEENQINNSFTAFTNQIGLSKGKEFLKYNSDIVLDFPFKDCILEGGQSNDEGKDNYYEYDDKKGFVLKQDRRQEIFYNNIIAQDEITRLTEKKAFTNFKKFTKDGEVPFEGFNKDENGNIKDNLIIKGNNLLALYSLKEKFAGKIKLIYIDPPYNTGNDSFSYNDKFNHSTWLTFMKNRLEVARELLREDGAIFVQCDDNEQAYLKVLMDEVFGKDNFISTIIWKGKRGGQDSKYVAKAHEFILLYSKNNSSLKLNKMVIEDNSNYNKKDEEGSYKLQLLRKCGSNSKRSDRPNLFYPVKIDDKEICPILPNGGDGRWRRSKERMNKALENNIVTYIERDNRIELYEKIYKSNGLKEIVFSSIIDESFAGQGIKVIEGIFGDKVFAYPKPEQLIKKLIELGTNPGDIVLDYHLGSGTTCAVAHKMGRQYIGVEQMDYIETIPVERLKKVIEGEQGGISKDVEWKGGGEFVYFELAKLNKDAIEKINNLKTYEEVKDFFLLMYDNYFLKYNIKTKEFTEDILESERFKKLSLDEQKAILITMIDNNQLYVNVDDMLSNKIPIADKENSIKHTNDFYI